MTARNIIEIDEEKCTGCGQCVIGCAEGALEIINGKARLVGDVFCDGLGACIGECPEDALHIIQREADEFDEAAVEERLEKLKDEDKPALACGCPGSLVQELKPMPLKTDSQAEKLPSALRNWPIQLHLIPPDAPFLNNANLLIAADCAGFSAVNLHSTLLRDRTLIIACPKLDVTDPYEEKLIRIFKTRNIKEVAALYMTVPCCFGLVHLVKQAIAKSGESIPLRLIKIDPSGTIVEEDLIEAA